VKRAALNVGMVALFGVLPLFAMGVVVADLAAGEAGWAFREAFLTAADAVLRGENPYPALTDPAVARGTAYVYPPVTALLVTPFTVLPEVVAVIGFALILIAAVPITLAILGVRDWRCYGLALLWPPVLSAVHVENITLLVGLAAALVWRFRDRPVGGGLTLGASIAVKPLLWPLGLWLAATRRLRALVWSISVGVILLLGSWAVIRFAGLVEYRELLRRLSKVMDEYGYSVYALALDLDVSDLAARLVWVVLAVGLLVASVVVARRGDDRRGFMLAVAATIACSPIVWLHYFALLLVVVALAKPRLGPVWFVPLLMYFSEEITNGTTFQTAMTIAAAALTVAVALGTPSAASGKSLAMRLQPFSPAERSH